MKKTNGTDDVKIERGIPMPETRTRVKYASLILPDMGIGDSLLVSDYALVLGFHQSANRLGMKVVSRRQPGGQFRAWRIK